MNFESFKEYKKLETYQDLVDNIGKKVLFYNNIFKCKAEGFLEINEKKEIVAAGCILCSKERYFDEKSFSNIELIEEDNQEELKNKFTDEAWILEEQEKKDNINHPSHYQLEINNKLVDVNTILEAISKKLDGKCDLMTWNYFSNACEYLLRSFFKGQQLSDLQKAKKEIEFIINKLEK